MPSVVTIPSDWPVGRSTLACPKCAGAVEARFSIRGSIAHYVCWPCGIVFYLYDVEKGFPVVEEQGELTEPQR